MYDENERERERETDRQREEGKRERNRKTDVTVLISYCKAKSTIDELFNANRITFSLYVLLYTSTHNHLH